MPVFGALSQAWTSAEASLPLGWKVSGLWRFDDLWVALGEGPAFEDYASGTGMRISIAPSGARDSSTKVVDKVSTALSSDDADSSVVVGAVTAVPSVPPLAQAVGPARSTSVDGRLVIEGGGRPRR